MTSPFAELVDVIRRQFSVNVDATHRSLSLGVRDSVTGWRAKNFSESPIEIIIIPQGASQLQLVAGVLSLYNPVGVTDADVKVGDEIETNSHIFYEVKTVTSFPAEATTTWYNKCDLTELPLHD